MGVERSTTLFCDKCDVSLGDGLVDQNTNAKDLRHMAKADNWSIGPTGDFCERCTLKMKSSPGGGKA